MKKKNKNIKAVMSVIAIFLVLSIATGVFMAVTQAKGPTTELTGDMSSASDSTDIQQSVDIADNSSSSESEKDDSAENDGNNGSSQTESVFSEEESSSVENAESKENSSVAQTPKPTPTPQTTATPNPTQTPHNTTVSVDMKAMWISYLEFQSVNFSSKSAFVSDMTTMFRNCSNMGLNTVIVQVRPFGDALYNSSVFPTSHLINGTQGAAVSYDPLGEMVQIAHSMGLRIEAWVNPYRVRLHSKMPDNIASSNPANDTALVFEANNGVYYNPALTQVQDLVVAGIEEIVKNYDVDGIHLDDYFYPATDLSLDAEHYKASRTNLSQENWRRENVNTLVRKIYSAIKAIDGTVTFGISPQGNNDNNYNMQYSDVNLWLSQKGYVDYVMPQIYWGFGYLTASGRTDYQFVNLCEKWESYPRAEGVKLYIGLGAYRIGDGDGGANDQGEWQSGNNLMKMVNTINSIDGIDGFALYRYDNLFENSAYSTLAQSETEHLADVLIQ